jgi:hypothetical protein
MKLSFEDAKRQYIYRYTMEHIPGWARRPCEGNGKFYAPQYSTDREWYDKTQFPPDSGHKTDCCSSDQSWPLGQWLDKPYMKA